MKRIRPVIGGMFFIGVFALGYLLIVLPRGEASGVVSGVAGAAYVIDGVLETDEVDVASKLPGMVAELGAREGDYVEAGQVIVVLSSEEIDAKMEQARAGLSASEATYEKGRIAADLERRSAESKVEQARAGLKASEAALGMARQKLAALERGARPQEIKMVEQSVVAAQASFDAARKTWERVGSLADEGVVARQKADEVEMMYRAAGAQLAAAKEKYDMVVEGARIEEVEAAREQVRQAEAGVEAAALTLRLAEDARLMVSIREKDVDAARQGVAAGEGLLNEVSAYKNNTVITSPISGRVSRRMVREGEIVAPGYALMTVTRTDGYWVDVYVDESRLAGRGVGVEVDVEIPALGVVTKGKITQALSAADFATKRATNETGSFDVRAVQLRVTLTGNVGNLVSGLTARVCFK